MKLEPTADEVHEYTKKLVKFDKDGAQIWRWTGDIINLMQREYEDGNK